MEHCQLRSHLNPRERNYTYKWSPDSKLAVECHGDFVFVSCSLIKGVARIKRWTIQVKAHSGLCVADVFHSM
jgi:hypothetical protein